MKKSFTITLGSIEEAYQIFCSIPEFEDPYPIEGLYERLSTVPHLILLAKVEEQIVGFKVGYEMTNTKFYSWLGAVIATHRQQGIAKALAIEQEKWLKEKGYTKLWMKTRNEHRNMLLFAIKNGFDLVKVEEEENSKKNRIWLKKNLEEK